jgi:translation initiation factor 1
MAAPKVVYSTGGGSRCGRCGHPAGACVCVARSSRPASGGTVRIRLEKKGRCGKSVTTIDGLALAAEGLAALAAALRRSCGAGGAVKDGVIEIQGDHRQRVLAELVSRIGSHVQGTCSWAVRKMRRCRRIFRAAVGRDVVTTSDSSH